MDFKSMIFGGCVIAFLIIQTMFWYEKGQESIAEKCKENRMFILKGIKYDCTIHTIP